MPESETAAPTKGKYVMSKVVPIAGLIIGCFARFENELNTVGK
jgi:hypothetical protein